MGLEIIIIIFFNYNSTKSFEMACLNNFETFISLFSYLATIFSIPFPCKPTVFTGLSKYLLPA